MNIPVNLDSAKLLFRVIKTIEEVTPQFGVAEAVAPPFDETLGEREGVWRIRPIQYQFSLVMRDFQWRYASAYGQPNQIEVNLYRTRMGVNYGFACNWMVNERNFDTKMMEIRRYLVENFNFPPWKLP